METGSVDVTDTVHFLDDFFQVSDLPSDPAFSRFVPMVYDPIGFAWRDFFEPAFAERFNGLMLRGADRVGKAWCISFPAEDVLARILARALPGDLIFSHHPINMECGDPRGGKGRGFVPLDPPMLQHLKDRGISFYSCHVPLDTHTEISTSDAIVRVLGGTVVDQFLPLGIGFAGRLCEVVPPCGLDELVETCKQALGLPYVDSTGNTAKDRITRVAVVAGGAGDVTFYTEADRLRADCLVAGEVTSKINNDIGRRKQAEIEAYLPTTELAAIGLSHAGSEFLVMKEVAPLIERELDVPAEAVPESRWWR